ncbi:hypothetical protein BGX24_003727 [Mortierella sp. AD032]|nr:hypothetical protein BGX24_003727 [Mortierella sp. AD032]
MPFLSLSNPRSRASLIAALLLLEFMAILWLRESSPKDGSGRGSLFNPRSQQQQQHVEQEEVLRFQVKKHHVPATKQQQKEQWREEEGGARLATHVVARSGKDTGQPQDDKRTMDTTYGNSNKDQGSASQQQQHKGHHHHRAAIIKTTQSGSKRARQSIKAKVSSLAAAAVASIPKARKVIKDNHSNKNNKSNNGRNKSAGKAKHPSEIKNRLGGFKSTKERKQAQLIPVLDEHGATIEDHFISPRDSDGDGIPDYFVLLRPSGDNAMDLGLFDDDVVVPVPVPIATAPTAAPPVILVTAPPPPVVPPKPQAAPEAVSPPVDEQATAGPSTIAADVDTLPSVAVM